MPARVRMPCCAVLAVLTVTGFDAAIAAVHPTEQHLASQAASAPAPTAAPVAASVAERAAEPGGYWTGPIDAPVPTRIAGGQVIHAKALHALLKRGKLVIIDVSSAPRRPDSLAPGAPWLPLPHAALPGAVWIPGAGQGELPEPLDRYYRERLASLTGHDLDRPVVVYCHARCWLSWNGARRAISYGYRHVYWFPDGIEGWRKMRLRTAVITPETLP